MARRNEKLVKLLDAIGDLDLGDFDTHEIDAFGDAYEYLMQMYASEAGKSGWRVLHPAGSQRAPGAHHRGKAEAEVKKVYDPAVRSVPPAQVQKILGPGKVRGRCFGREINLTWNLARINMFLHDIPTDPVSSRSWGYPHRSPALRTTSPLSDRFQSTTRSLGRGQQRAADQRSAVAQKPVCWLPNRKPIWRSPCTSLPGCRSGTAAIVEFPGVLYRGGAEQKIRQYLIDNNYVDTVIQLPPDLFFGTTIATYIIV
ncbi:MAG: N-6 DNA methylase [Thermomicrobiales bacterium]